MPQSAINVSPFRCRWIATGTEMHIEQWTYANYERCPNQQRVVSEDECRCWEPRAAARHAADARDAEFG